MPALNEALHHFTDSLTELYHCELTTNDVDFLTRFFVLQPVKKKKHLIEAGAMAAEVYFIHRGILRVYFIDHNGNEINQQFFQAGEVVAPLFSLTCAEPSPFYLQALTPGEVLVANYPKLQKTQNHFWLTAENALLRAVFLKTARREAQMLLGTAEQRYRWFLKENPQLAKQLPLYQIASYLGVTPVSLSRLRKKLSQPDRANSTQRESAKRVP